MKRKTQYILVLIGLLIMYSGCSKIKLLNKPHEKRKDFCIGVIETTGQKNKSVLTFYDENLTKVDSDEINLGSMGTFFDPAQIHNDCMYVIPQGIRNQKEKTIVLGYNIKDGTHKEYDLKLTGMNSFSITEDNVYGVATLNLDSTINKLNKSSNELQSLLIPDMYVEWIGYYDNHLYAFGDMKKDGGTDIEAYLYIIDDATFTIKDRIDITQYGIGQEDAMFMDGQLIFTNTTMNDGSGKSLGIFNIQDQTFTTIDLSEGQPSQILPFNDKLLILHNDLVTGEGNKISVLDPKTFESEVITLEQHIGQIKEQNGRLFGTDDINLYEYKLQDNKITVVNQIDPFTTKNSPQHFYLGSLFTSQ